MENKIKAPTANERRIIKFLILLGICSIIFFLIYFFKPAHAGNKFLFVLLTITILYSVLKKLYMWYNYSNISVPEEPQDYPQFKVDILTTYFPGEPYQMTITTLEAINQITYPHTAYLCDEANDPYLKKFCEENGIIHVTRDNRINAKAGNINNALRNYATGEICVVLDPDHIPEPNFLDPIIPHFKDPQIGFVQIVQSYYNIKETLVARGAAEQTFQFYGPMMMTLNSYGAVNAIGANCVFRRAALDSIGGHAPGLCEDMHTAMLLYSKGWKAVYLPEVLARGLAPSNLTNFFKQQLKWSRGTFDLLFKVYPKIFNSLTWRQRIHYGILPFHYLAGVIFLINFLIPVLSLLFSITPWRGDVVDFALVLIPVAASSLLIRTYIQKWVIEKKERGFHLVGGLLHINTWWIYILGFVYTVIDKKVPYLPTPKEDEWNTNLKIIIPNAIVAFLSIFAVIFGLSRDLTPFSIIMAGFAFFNACIMIFGIYLTFRVTNQNRILRGNLAKKPLTFLWHTKHNFYKLANTAFTTTRMLALPLLLLLLILSMSFKQLNDLSKWEQVKSPYSQKTNNKYLGIFHPRQEGGLSDIKEINLIENVRNVNFDIISLYIAWNNKGNFPHQLIESIYENNAIPMITWEPWTSGLEINDSIPELQNNQMVFQHISEGYFDEYIIDFAQNLKSYENPVYLRFGHEFDNPQYPWSGNGNKTAEEFVAAWRHVHDLIRETGAHQVMMVWNPWKPFGMEKFFPGDNYVDWVGLTLLNYGPLNPNGKSYSFEELYQPFDSILNNLTNKPVMLAEFGSVKLGNQQKEWHKEAFNSINGNNNISSVVLFNSTFDKNIPANDWYKQQYINWTINFFKEVSDSFKTSPVKLTFPTVNEIAPKEAKNPITQHEIRGVRYKKGANWRKNYYALTRNVLLEDFKLMKETGINTIQFTGGNIYDYNILSYSKKAGLNVIYQFHTGVSGGYTRNQQNLRKAKREILDQVEKLEKSDHVIGYSFSYELENYFEKPLLFAERAAYINWLQSVIRDIKKIDPERSIVIDLPLDKETKYQLKKLQETLPVDSFGLIVNETEELEDVLNYAEENDIPVFLSSLNPESLTNDLTRVDLDIVLQNWQDERYSNWMSFDGLLNFNSDKKEIFKNIENTWAGDGKNLQEETIKILRPAENLLKGKVYKYHAVLYQNKEWIHPSNEHPEFEFAWYLVKNDDYGNPLAVKNIGKGPTVDIKIPGNYPNHQVLLTAKGKDGYVISSKSNLHTPLENAKD